MSRLRSTSRWVGSASAALIALIAAAGVAAAATPPVAPSALTVNQTLSWVDNSTDETGFSIERCLGSGCTTFGQIATVGADVTTFTDSFRASGVDRYRVRAFNAAGYSGYSDVAETMVVGTGEVFPVVAAAPLSGSAPLTVAFDGSGSTSLSGSITGYSWSFGDDQAATGATVSHTYAAPGVYAASLKVTGGPFGSADVTAVIITVTAPPLVAPNDLTATSPARNRALLTWTNPASSATSLTVERCKGSTCTRFTKIAVLPTTATSYLDTAVKGGTTYTYRLTATGATGSVVSNRATVTVRR